MLLASVLCLLLTCNGKVNVKNVLVVGNVKEYKKVLKTHTNVLTLYSKDDKSVLSTLRLLDGVAKEVKGKGTIVYINCGEDKESKKLCKKYNVNPKPKLLKHYKDGAFHKDFDRKETSKSMLTFMLDPSGDAPWEEDPTSKSVVHIISEKDLIKLRRKEKGPMLIMFYAPWCGYCKKLKPDYSAAAAELKGKAVLVGMDVDKPDAFNVRYQFNITGFPTLIYFEKGEEKYRYAGKYDKQGLIDWLADPQPEGSGKKDEEEETPWSSQAPEILHLTDATFDENLKANPSILVMFYAPWCGHCKNMKPEYVDASKQMKEEEIAGSLAAVDCTKEPGVCKKFDVSGYPTIKYFANAEYKFKLSIRTKDKIIEFMKNPEAPPPPPPEDLPWAEVSSPEILHLEDDSFKESLKKKKHVLVMFYAPWCGHCKKAKPEIEKAAEHYKDDRKVWYAGVDCTVHRKSCERFDVSGYPTFRYFLYGKKDFAYNGDRTANGLIDFMKDPTDKPAPVPPAEEEWKDTPSDVVHLGDDDFDKFISDNPSVLVMFYAPWCGHCKSMKPAYTEAAGDLVGKDHVLAAVDCTKNRKVAGKYEIKGYPTLKYFKDGKDSEYEGGRSKEDLISFLTGGPAKKEEVPKEPTWADENQDVKHLNDGTFDDFVASNPSVLVMFYAPWCGHCQRMKPAYGEAAKVVNTENKVDGQLAAVDCTTNPSTCRQHSITGYPTLKYFKNSVKDQDYDGGREKEEIIKFMINPQPLPPKPVEKSWAEEDQHVSHLTDNTFGSFMEEHRSVLVMFYAPWCGHCKKMKPAFSEAAEAINSDSEIDGKLAAVDCTANDMLPSKYDIKGYPTLKYFKDGEEVMKYQKPRTKEALLEFMRNPGKKESEQVVKEWKDEPSDVHHLTMPVFDQFLKGKDVLVMFHAPWCGHCTSMKPAYMQVAKHFKEENFPGVLAAVDATKERELVKREGVTGYPTLKYYSNGVFVENFEEHRTVENLINFMKKNLDSNDRRAASVDEDTFEEIPSSVVHLQKDTFEPHIEKTQHVLVMFHVKWCEHCAELRADLMQAASRLSSSPNMGIADVNCDLDGEHCHSHGVTSFPTIKYYGNGKFVENYSGELNADAFTAYLQAKATKEEL